MFFLGGLNTALPYLLYLSLIWAFMIIGITGRYHFNLSHQTHEYRTTSDVKSISYTIHHFDQQLLTDITETPLRKRITYTVIIIPDKNPGILLNYLTNLPFRGPPIRFMI